MFSRNSSPAGWPARWMLFVGALLALAVGVSAWMAESSAASSRSAAPAAAHLWLTTADGTYKLTDMGEIPFGAGQPTVPTVVVDPSRTFQTMDGFGGAITDSSAVVLYRMSPAARAAAMRMLFDPRTGDGLSYLRQPIGGSDFVATAPYTYDDMPAGATDYPQRHFSIAHDEAEILPLLREAKRLNPRLQIVASPWSPPAWMKTGDSLIGGRLIDTPRIYHSYALYLTKFIEAYRSQGVTVNTITVQNEPQNRTPGNYPGTDMSAAQEDMVIEALGPMLRAAGLRTQILAYDHNWSEHPNDIASTPPDETMDTNDYPQEVLSSPAARWVSGTAYHCYYGDPSAMTTLHDEFPAKNIYFTECSGSQSTDPANTFSDTLKWHARNLIIGSPRNWAKTVINWNVALDPSGGPHVGGCGNCTGILTIGPGDRVTPDAEYYTLGHLSRFVQPGAVRIASTSFGTTGWNGEVMDVAFRSRTGRPCSSRTTRTTIHRPSAFSKATAASRTPFPETRWPRSRGPGIRATTRVCGSSIPPAGRRRPAHPGRRTRVARAMWRPTPSTTTRAPVTRPEPDRRQVSTSRSTSAVPSRCARSSSTPASISATIPAVTP